MNKLHLEQVASTNTWLLDSLKSDMALEEETLVYTLNQTQGRGQLNNSWESEPGKNITFSLLLRPVFLHVSSQFVLSELCCLGILEGLKALVNAEESCDSATEQLCIKWPNDIYWGDEKLGGILIENRLMGSTFSECIMGVGLNVNQTKWVGNAPNPTSLRLHGFGFEPEQVLANVAEGIVKRYRMLKMSQSVIAPQLHAEFMQNLYRRKGWHPYVDARTGEAFEAVIAGVDPHGPLNLKLQSGESRKYWFKEVKFALPCGVIKE